MRVKTIVDEDFVQYKKPSMFIGTIACNGKCCREANLPLSVCQNDGWRSYAPIYIQDEELIQRYLDNSITSAICFGGLEPFEQFYEMIRFIYKLRVDFQCNDDVVIYTGYYSEELKEELLELRQYPNITVKFGRFIPDCESRYDEILGVSLASPNQYAQKIS